MKKGRFLWSAHRITKKQKAGKARNIKEKQLKNSRSTASKPLVALRSSASADHPLIAYSKAPFMRTVPFCSFTAALLHIRKSAQHLDISRSTLWRMLK